MRVQEFDGTAREWNDFVRDREEWTHFHLYEWRDLIRDVHGHDTRYLAARSEDGDLSGVLPLVRVHNPLFGHYVVSMPFVNYGGPLGSAEAVDALADRAVTTARGEGADLLEMRSRERRDLSLPVSHRRVTVVLDLPDDAGTLWDALDGSVRNQVRKPDKKGVDVRFGPDQIAPFFRVFSQHMRDLGIPTQPRSLFASARETFGDDVWFGCAYHEGEPVACGAGFRWNGEFEMTWASALMEHRSLCANMLLYWRFMERAIGEGLDTFNFGRCPPDSGRHRFKKQWGSRDEELWWYQHAANGTEATPSHEDDALYADWGPKLWQELPLPVANALGPRVVRYIP